MKLSSWKTCRGTPRNLTDEQAREVWSSTAPKEKIAKKFGISERLVVQIKNGKKYQSATLELRVQHWKG